MKKDEKQSKKKESGKDNKEKYGHMTDQEIKQLAEDIYKGLVFTDRHVQTSDDVSRVFMTLVLMGKELSDELKENPPGMIYEYMDKAGPMAINGMPMFLSCRLASIDDTKKVFEHYNKIKEAVANA